MRRPTVALLGALTLVVAVTGPVAAAPPGNDTLSTATEVTEPLPFVDIIDTSEATADLTDGGCGGPDDLATVWYSFTPTASADYLATGVGSDYLTGANVFLNTAEGLELIACAQPGAVFFGEAGQTYLIMVAACCEGVNGGLLTFTLDLAPPPLQIVLSIDPTATLDRSTGAVTVTGSVSCDREAFVGIEGSLRQRAGRLFIDAFFFTEVSCSPEGAAWSAEALPSNGVFSGGKATVSAFAFSFDGDGFADASAQVRIRR